MGCEIGPVYRPRYGDEGVVFFTVCRLMEDGSVEVFFDSTHRSATGAERQTGMP